jgi:hypothetical protein
LILQAKAVKRFPEKGLEKGEFFPRLFFIRLHHGLHRFSGIQDKGQRLLEKRGGVAELYPGLGKGIFHGLFCSVYDKEWRHFVHPLCV